MENQDSGSATGTILKRIGHYSDQMIIAAMFMSMVTYFLAPSTRVLMFLLYLIATSMALISGRKHAKSLCLHCAVEAPLDFAAEADRKHNRLVVFHRFDRPRYIVLLLVIQFVGSRMGPVLDATTWCVALLLFSYSIISATSHSQLQPWCPYCRDDGDSDVEIPDPVPTSEKQPS